jgi:photosystem II stability/assembly factor-like uncharacterized protein
MALFRAGRLLCALVCCTLLIFLAFLASPLHAANPGDAFLADAELTSVQFITADRGWAVGDRGVIWHTRDGGRTWSLQRPPIHCRFEAVQFLNENIGFVVGSQTQPHSHLTRAVLLKTRNAGETWTEVRTDTLPGLRGVKFFDAKTGWIWGDSSSLYPTGVFRTIDGGLTWTPISKGNTSGWIAGDFRDQRSGAVVGLSGELGLVAGVEIRPTRTSDLGLRYLRRMQFTAGLGGWLIGDGGLVMSTPDSGFSWTMPTSPLPSEAMHFDFRALAVQGSHCWIAGSPGTVVFHSPDEGKTWRTYRTGRFTPIHSLTFIDEHRGWAVGSFGQILATRDSGKTWRPQHSGGTRAALMGVVSEPQRVPWEVIANYAGNEGYLTTMEVLGRSDRDGQPTSNASLPRRSHEAVVAVGGSHANTYWQLPLRATGSAQTMTSVLAHWNEITDGRATRLATEHLVRQIRTWRPEVIVTEDVSPRGDDPLAHITNQLLLSAVPLAADTTFAPEQLSHAGLEAWKVKKVYCVQSNQRSGQVTLSPSQWAPRLGGSIGEHAQHGSGLIFTDYERGHAQIGLSLLVDHLPQQSGRRDLFSGIALMPGGDARRELPEVVQGNLEALSKAAQKRHNVQQLLSQADQNDPASIGWLGQADDLTKGLSQQSGGEVLFQLAQKYQQAGRTDSAVEALQLLMDRYPQHSLTDRAAVLLLQHATSGEVAWRERRGTKYDVQLATATTPLEDPANQPTRQPGEPLPRTIGPVVSNTVGEAQRGTAAPQVASEERGKRAIALGKQIEQLRPALAAEPSIRFPLAAAHRLAGNDRIAERMLDSFSNLGEQNPWAQAVAAEHWRRHANGLPPKACLTCMTAPGKPKLDGRLDDAIWQLGKPTFLRTAADDEAARKVAAGSGGTAPPAPAVVVAMWDQEFLYLAVNCAKAPGLNYAPDASPRPRDSDLSAHDQLQIHLDIDRDYSSFYTLALDSRGFTAESLLGDTTWNPTWFVAVAEDEHYWSAEIAIPWSELTQQPPTPRDLWTVGIQRLTPGQPLQAFNHPATAKVRPEAFGLWIFE